MKSTFTLLATTAIILASTVVFAHPLDGQVPKFQQLPMVETYVEGQVYYGHDEESTIYNLGPIAGTPEYPLVYSGNYVADDFADVSRMPVVHVQWWGSYLRDDNPDLNFPIKKFLITFEQDVAADDSTNLYDFSHPGQPILSQVVTLGDLSPGSGTFTETSIHPGGSPMYEELFEYNAELACPFEQKPNTVYWIKIAAMVDIEDFDGSGQVDLEDVAMAPLWGWHNRDYTQPNPLAATEPDVKPGEKIVGSLTDGTAVWHFQDDAVANGSGSGMEAIVYSPDVPCEVEVNQLLSQLPPYVPDFVPQSYQPNVDGPPEIGLFSKDLAFVLYSEPVPEPSTILFLALGSACLAAIRRRRGM